MEMEPHKTARHQKNRWVFRVMMGFKQLGSAKLVEMFPHFWITLPCSAAGGGRGSTNRCWQAFQRCQNPCLGPFDSRLDEGLDIVLAGQTIQSEMKILD